MSTAPTIATFFSCTLTVCFLCVGTGTPSAEKRAPGSPRPLKSATSTLANCASSDLSGFCRIRLSHRNVGIFGTVRRFLYWRRRRVWELAHVKLHHY